MSAPVAILDERFRACVLPNAALEVLGEGCRWLEGPVWFADHRCLYVSDLPNDRVMRWTEEGGLAIAWRPAGFANGHARDADGRLLTCHHEWRSVTRREWDGSTTVLADRLNGRRLNAPNDIACRSDGTIWFTDPLYGLQTDYEGGKQASERPAALMRIDPDGSLHVAAEDYVGPNGVALSHDERSLWVTETGAQFAADPIQCIRRHAIAADGALSGGESFAHVSPGEADGIALDRDGRLWSSAGDGVHVFDPDGTLIGRVEVGSTVSNLCFGDRHRSRLFLCAGERLLALFTNVRGAGRL